MIRRFLLALAMPLALAVAPASAQVCASPQSLHAPQPVLPKEKLVIVGHDGTEHDFSVEMALSPEQIEIGLMSRTSVPADGGMLFDLGPPQQARFWMCNTVIPLDMVFIKADGTIDSIAENTVPQSLATVESKGPVRATLELAAGTAARLGIRVGDKVRQRIFGTAA
jgi:uncharacterized membrane protein (UPF0127 family)